MLLCNDWTRANPIILDSLVTLCFSSFVLVTGINDNALRPDRKLLLLVLFNYATPIMTETASKASFQIQPERGISWISMLPFVLDKPPY